MLEENRLSLVDLATGARRPLEWPSIIRKLDEIVVQPHGTLVAVAFRDPGYGPGQAADVWILDTATGKFTHLPGFPAQVRLKFSSMAWTSDDRLVLLFESGKRTVLAVWRRARPPSLCGRWSCRPGVAAAIRSFRSWAELRPG